ncbi:MAG: GNAT family N-acetyltransferase [Gammaproteobacteria bacterium]|nr:MAG: GNAT family N-acetyltransferase [Gammaproteobacteria bacterium]
MSKTKASRLLVRKFNHEDAEFIIQLLNEPSFIENIADKGIKNQQDAFKYLDDGPIASYKKFGFGLCMVELLPPAGSIKASVPIGMCGLIKREELEDVDLGYAFLPNYCGRGYAEESAKMVLEMAKKQFNLNRVVAITKVGNQSSEKLLRKLGFNYEKLLTMYADENKYFSLDF